MQTKPSCTSSYEQGLEDEEIERQIERAREWAWEMSQEIDDDTSR